jgi:hypothetical protein
MSFKLTLAKPLLARYYMESGEEKEGRERKVTQKREKGIKE